MQPGDVVATPVDIQALEDWVGFRPSAPIQEGVDCFARWYWDFLWCLKIRAIRLTVPGAYWLCKILSLSLLPLGRSLILPLNGFDRLLALPVDQGFA